jgi:EamA domain-containing membrane protein RarD
MTYCTYLRFIRVPTNMTYCTYKLLRKFMHKDALVSALIENSTRRIVAVMEELVIRRKLVRCIRNLEKDELVFC